MIHNHYSFIVQCIVQGIYKFLASQNLTDVRWKGLQYTTLALEHTTVE